MSDYMMPSLLGWTVCAMMMLALWLVQRRTQDAGIVDVGWTAGLGLLAILYAFLGSGWAPRRMLIAVLVSIWSLRLATYLLFNRVLRGPEDGRYQTLRKNWGPRAPAFFFWFFQAQGLLDVLLATPFLLICANASRAFGAIEIIGATLWLLAQCGEMLADRQLAHFRAKPAHKGRTCRNGLWRYSRHPNYFCEWLMWLSYALIAWPAPFGWVALFAPAFILYLIVFITGIPPTEAQALQSRGQDYRDYQRTTSAFVPWFPKRGM